VTENPRVAKSSSHKDYCAARSRKPEPGSPPDHRFGARRRWPL